MSKSWPPTRDAEKLEKSSRRQMKRDDRKLDTQTLLRKKKKAKCKFPQNARPTAAIFGKNAHSFMLATVLDVANYGVVSNSAGKMPVEYEAST